MKVLVILAFSLSVLASVDPATVRKINTAKAQAEEAFKRGDYKSAVSRYKYLVDSLGVDEDEVRLNLANAYYLAKDTANAFPSYQNLITSTNPVVLSKANQQLGVMTNQRGKFEEALNYFKQAIKAAPSNDDARFNYEMLKKKLEEQKKQDEKQKQNKEKNQKDQQNKDQQDKENQEKKDQQKDQQNKDQKKKDEQNKDQQKKNQDQQDKEKKEQQQKEQQQKDKEKEQQPQDARKDEMPNLDRDKLEQMKITEEKARMILEAMKNQEKQYLQQQKRKSSQSRDRNKPDW
jgi:Ca-activated chloride channel family protein